MVLTKIEIMEKGRIKIHDKIYFTAIYGVGLVIVGGFLGFAICLLIVSRRC